MSRLIDDLLDVAAFRPAPCGSIPSRRPWPSWWNRPATASRAAREPTTCGSPPDLPPVMADPQRIVQVLGNLLSNAARHAPRATPIRLSAVKEQVHVAVTVSDRGRGVPAEQLPHLFRKFPRLDEPHGEEGNEGSGLGLAICRGLVEAHGGRIRAASDGEGRGTRITFTLPIAEETGLAAVPASRRRRRRRGKETRILVVDDDPETLRKVRDALSKAGYLSIVTGDPEQVSSLMEEHRPHLVLLDLVLPGVDGIELMQELSEKARHLPVRLRPGRCNRPGLRRGGFRLRGQALLSDGTDRQNQGCPAPSSRPWRGRTNRTVCAGGVDRRLPPAKGDPGRTAGPVDGHRVPAVGGAFRRSGNAGDLRRSAAPGGALSRPPTGGRCARP